MPDTERPFPLREHARGLIIKSLSLSPLSAHFLESSAKRLGVSQSEFTRRVLDATLMEWLKHGLYTLPDELKAGDPEPMPQARARHLAAVKRTQSVS